MLNTIFFKVYSTIISKFYKIEIKKELDFVNSGKSDSSFLIQNKIDKILKTKKQNNQYSNQWLIIREDQIIGKFVLSSVLDEFDNNMQINYHIVPEKTFILNAIEIKSTDKSVLNNSFNLIILQIFTEMIRLDKNRILISGTDYCLKKIHRLGIKTKLIYSPTNFTSLVLGNTNNPEEFSNTHVIKIKPKRLFKTIWKLIFREIQLNLSNDKSKESKLILTNQ